MKLKHYIVTIIIILIDQLTKYFAINKNIIIIPNFLYITYTKNIGAAFGIGTINLITIINIVFLIAIVIFLIKENKKITYFFPYILILSGTIGNLIDRLFRRYVIDFINIDLLSFPCFNIADICITIGIFVVILTLTKQIFENKN